MTPTRTALILAAGMGSRLAAEEGFKILARLGQRPMIDHHLGNFARLGVEAVVVVTGHEHEALEAKLASWPTPAGTRGKMKIRTVYNPEYRLGNGVSVLVGAAVIDGPFWLSMSDHVFEPTLFDGVGEGVAELAGEGAEGVLVVDHKLDEIFDVPDVNKLRFGDDGRLDAIGKEIGEFDTADAGLFWCGPGFVEALRAEREARGDCNTSDAVARLDARRAMGYWDLGAARWQDVDTPEAREHAERLMASW